MRDKSIPLNLKLDKDETILTAYAESASGPGWANQPLWVVVRDSQGHIRLMCIQPSQGTKEMGLLYAVSQVAHLSMTHVVRQYLKSHQAQP